MGVRDPRCWAILDAGRWCGAPRTLSTAAADRAQAAARYPQACGTCPRVAMICVQIAIIPKKSASDANAAASSITARNMIPLPDKNK
jgi:hypothetical protein